MISDPAMLKSKKCRCGKPLPDAAVHQADPWCSVECCRIHHGVTIAIPEGHSVTGHAKSYIDKNVYISRKKG